MVDFLRAWIINITVIIIFVMFLDTIMPNDSMKRYINVIVGFIIIIVIIKPFVQFKNYADGFRSEYLETASFLEQKDFGENTTEISKFQKQKAVEIFESNLKNQILKQLKNNIGSEYKEISIDLSLERNFESETFGDIKGITVNLSKDKKEVIEVDKIKIDAIGSTGANKNVIKEDKVEYNLNDSKISSEIKDEISKTLGVSKSIISVNVEHY